MHTHRMVALVAALGLLAPLALAHSNVYRYEHEGETYWYGTQHGNGGWYKETNGLVSSGVNSSSKGGQGVFQRPLNTELGGEYQDTGLQVHDVCLGIFTWWDVETWNKANHGLVFNYVPWQTGSAGYEDDPGKWLYHWYAHHGLDLLALERDGVDLAEECEARGGTFLPADEYLGYQGETTPWGESRTDYALRETQERPVETLQSGVTAVENLARERLSLVDFLLTALRNACNTFLKPLPCP